MAGPVARRAFRRPLYSGTAVASLRLAAVLTLALGVSGCAVSGPLGSMFAKQSKDEARAYASEDVTGSVGIASRIAGVGLDRGPAFGNRPGVSRAWPSSTCSSAAARRSARPGKIRRSGARGTVTPIASAYDKDGGTCRDFLASYVRRQGPETWLQGEACRAKQGASWEVKSLRPWSRS